MTHIAHPVLFRVHSTRRASRRTQTSVWTRRSVLSLWVNAGRPQNLLVSAWHYVWLCVACLHFMKQECKIHAEVFACATGSCPSDWSLLRLKNKPCVFKAIFELWIEWDGINTLLWTAIKCYFLQAPIYCLNELVLEIRICESWKSACELFGTCHLTLLKNESCA